MAQLLKVLVTGATGFVGSHIVPRLVDQGYDVYCLERYVTGRYILGADRTIKTVFGDLKQNAPIKQIAKQVQPDIVIHLAAISPVAYSYDHPYEVIETNFLGTVNLAESCLSQVPQLKHFLFASTSETYGNGSTPKSEDTRQNPNSPYAVSKLASEKYLQYLYDAYDFPITLLRPFNTYGRKENNHFVVERIIVQMLEGKQVKLGDPTAIRDLMYVDDHVNAYLTCVDNPEKCIGQVFNFCTSQATSIQLLADTIRNITGFEGNVIWNTIPQRPLDIAVLVGDYSKAKRLLGWIPKFGLEEGLKLTMEFWRKKIEPCD